MTKQELNRDIKRLYKKIENLKEDDNYFDIVNNEIKKEFKRLYYADPTAEYLSKTSIIYLMRINHKYRFIYLHIFGLQF